MEDKKKDEEARLIVKRGARGEGGGLGVEWGKMQGRCRKKGGGRINQKNKNKIERKERRVFFIQKDPLKQQHTSNTSHFRGERNRGKKK